jgi:hypothetical protein
MNGINETAKKKCMRQIPRKYLEHRHPMSIDSGEQTDKKCTSSQVSHAFYEYRYQRIANLKVSLRCKRKNQIVIEFLYVLFHFCSVLFLHVPVMVAFLNGFLMHPTSSLASLVSIPEKDLQIEDVIVKSMLRLEFFGNAENRDVSLCNVHCSWNLYIFRISK